MSDAFAQTGGMRKRKVRPPPPSEWAQESAEQHGANLSALNWDMVAKALGTRLCEIFASAESDMEARRKIVERFRESPARLYEEVTDAELEWLMTRPIETETDTS